MEESNLNGKLETEEKNTTVINESDVIVKKNRGELNDFLFLIMSLSIPGTIISSIYAIIMYHNLTSYGQPFFWGISILLIITTSIHIFGVIYTLKKQSIIGIWIIFGNILAGVLAFFVFNNILKSSFFDMNEVIMQAFGQTIAYSLLLLLRCNKKSAWKLLWENYKFDSKQKKITQNNETIENQTRDTLAPLFMTEKVAEISINDELINKSINATVEEIFHDNANNNEIIDDKYEIQPKMKQRKPKTWFYVALSIFVIIVGIVAYWQITEHKKKEKEEQKQRQIEYFSQKGKEAYNNELYAVSIAYCQKIIEIDSAYSKAYSGIGKSYFYQENYVKAIEYLEKSILLNPNDSATYLVIGDAYHNQEKYDKAIEYYSKALEIDPNFIDAYISLGFTYTIKGDYQQAMVYLQQAIKMNPTNSIGFRFIGRLYETQKQYKKALEFYHKSLEINESGWTYSNMAFTYYLMGNYQKQKESNIKGALLNNKDCQKWCRENGIDWEI